jgi:chromate transporter
MVNRQRANLWDIFIIWLVIGIQSFGGGTSTLLLIHQTCIKKGWLEEDEFVRDWAMVQISPGINLVKFTALIGYRLLGWPGLATAMAGLLLPSSLATVLMTAGFFAIRDLPVVQAAMKGILPATVGLSVTMSIQMGQTLLNRAHKEGPLRLSAHLLILVAAALLMAFTNLSPVLMLLICGGASIFLLAIIPIKKKQAEEKPMDKESTPSTL